MRLEPLRAEHASELWPIRSDPRVARWLDPIDREAFAARVAEIEPEWEGGFGLWLVRDAATGAALGWGGIRPSVVDGAVEVEAAWMIDPARWGEGIATRVGRAALALAAELGLPSVVAFTDPGNAASRAVMERLGMGYERDFDRAGPPQVLYRVSPYRP